MTNETTVPTHFLRKIIKEDLASGRTVNIATRFPPEPNGYLHVGHAKSICLNFGLAKEFGGTCNLRFDDTNPEKESDEYIQSIKNDVEWLGFQWSGEERYASNYFDQLHAWAIELIKKGFAYVCDLNPTEAREYRGTLKTPGKNSPFRERTVEENLALFERMGNGEFDEGQCSLRAKIDMASPNMNMRDPIIYRIRKVSHHQTGDKWCIYPMYDFTHGLSDALEGISHSICTLEFEDHRPLYDWFIAHVDVPAVPRQFEFARLNLNYTVTSKRKLLKLVESGIVNGWDDPRMPTISGMRRRGFTSASIRNFCEMIGVTRQDSVVDLGMLEFSIRDDLDKNAPRAMCVLDPVEIEITNYEGDDEWFMVPGHPQKDDFAERKISFGRHLVIDRADFREEANKKYKRLVLGKEVRLRGAYVIRADEVIKNEAGEIVKIKCTYDADTRGQNPADGRKVKGVIHWVSQASGQRATVRLYDRLFTNEAPDRADGDYMDYLNPEALTVVENAWIEPSLVDAEPESRFQFEREGYFVADRYEHSAATPVFNKTIGLRDSWAKIENK